MSDQPKENQDKDILDEVKTIEKMTKRYLIIKTLGSLKKKARQVLEMKEECTFTLAELGIDEKDVKRIIDFVNNLPEVQMTDEDRKELKERCRRILKDEKEKIEKKMDEVKPLIPFYGDSVYGDSGLVSSMQQYNTTAGNMVLTNTAGTTLEVKI